MHVQNIEYRLFNTCKKCTHTEFEFNGGLGWLHGASVNIKYSRSHSHPSTDAITPHSPCPIFSPLLLCPNLDSSLSPTPCIIDCPLLFPLSQCLFAMKTRSFKRCFLGSYWHYIFKEAWQFNGAWTTAHGQNESHFVDNQNNLMKCCWHLN